jgi:hypothetical protein
VLQLSDVRARLGKLQTTSQLHVVWGQIPAQELSKERKPLKTDMLQLQAINSLSSDNMLRSVTAVQQVMTELKGTVTEEARAMTNTKLIMEQNGEQVS